METKQETKVCKRCGKALPLDQFARNRWGVTAYCKDCNKVIHAKGKAHDAPAPKSEPAPAPQVEIKKPRKRYIENVTDEELVEELHRRGYTGTLTQSKSFSL